MSDGPAGLRMPTDKFPEGKPTYCLPCISLLANTFNENVLYNIHPTVEINSNNTNYMIYQGKNMFYIT